MDKIGKPRGLITYEPEMQRSSGQRWRLWGYGMAVTITAVLTLVSVLNHDPLSISIQRDRLSLYQLTPDDTVSNRYILSLHNRTAEQMTVDILDNKLHLAQLVIGPGARAGQAINIERDLSTPSGKVHLTLAFDGQQQIVEVSYSNPYANQLAAN